MDISSNALCAWSNHHLKATVLAIYQPKIQPNRRELDQRPKSFTPKQWRCGGGANKFPEPGHNELCLKTTHNFTTSDKAKNEFATNRSKIETDSQPAFRPPGFPPPP